MVDTEQQISFDFNVPIIKAFESDESDRIVHGVASTERKDLQQEIVIQKGIDTSELLRNGKINWNHRAKVDPGAIIGRVLEAGLNNEGNFYVKGKLYKGIAQADSVWELANYYANNPDDGRLGWSIEGSGVRKGNVVVKTMCRHVALTDDPVQVDTWADIVKAVTAGGELSTERELVCHDGICQMLNKLAKSLNTGNASAMLLENLDSGQRGAILHELFFGPSSSPGEIWAPDGTYKNGPLSAHAQLVAKGVDHEVAAEIIKKLHQSKIFG